MADTKNGVGFRLLNEAVLLTVLVTDCTVGGGGGDYRHDSDDSIVCGADNSNFLVS